MRKKVLQISNEGNTNRPLKFFVKSLGLRELLFSPVIIFGKKLYAIKNSMEKRNQMQNVCINIR